MVEERRKKGGTEEDRDVGFLEAFTSRKYRYAHWNGAMVVMSQIATGTVLVIFYTVQMF